MQHYIDLVIECDTNVGFSQPTFDSGFVTVFSVHDHDLGLCTQSKTVTIVSINFNLDANHF